MGFCSYSFPIFLAAVYVIFYFTGDRYRWLVLLTASYLFYAFQAGYLPLVLLLVTGLCYWCGLRIAAHRDRSLRRRWLWTGSAGCLATLAFFKYLAFPAPAPHATMVTIGISYFTLQALSYLADVYLGVQRPARHPGQFALYLAFFPKLLQGPIERAGDLMPQIERGYRFDYQTMRSGMLLFSWGLFQKVIVADRLAAYANWVYDDVAGRGGLLLLIGTYAYAFQIFYDFAGYTDMARGVGRIFGFELSKNFDAPYLATSVADFWRRWHISFSRCLLDYLFQPLQMMWRYQGRCGTALALVVTFLASGLWHGAAWTFLVWGLLHGLYICASIFYLPYAKRLHTALGVAGSRWLRCWQVLATFHLVSFAWIFFRANSLADAWHVVKTILAADWLVQPLTKNAELCRDLVTANGKGNFLVLAASLVAIAIGREAVKRGFRVENCGVYARWGLYVVYLLAIVLFKINEGGDFVYYRF